ncbi:MAG: peptidoglycan -binding protein [Alphaproteobacteria bacterium]|nr:peptidoglycan -binding protein [Alphaproteobacteria bacterium SS10]
MPLPPRRNGATAINVWPGWVDALSSLLMVVIFVLLVFTMAQFFLQFALTGRDLQLDRLNSQINQLTEQLALQQSENTELELTLTQLTEQLATATEQRDATRAALAERTEERDNLEDRLISIEAALATSQANTAETEETVDLTLQALRDQEAETRASRQQIQALNAQLAALSDELARLNALLEVQEADIAEKEAQIVNLGERLNQALANRVQELARYRSEFFGRLREILGERDDVRIVGDRFVFQSEVLFASGSDVLEPAGQEQLAQLAVTLQDLASEFPEDLNWILRIDGHTDDVPISTPEFPSNWELSSARAISVLKFLADQGIAERRLAATGFGEYQPIETGETAEARLRNRRIELKFDQR